MKLISKSQLEITRTTLQAIKDNCEEELKNSLTKENKKNCEKVRLYQTITELLKENIWKTK